MVTKTDLTSAGVSRFRTAKAVSEGSQWPVSTWVTTPGEDPDTAKKHDLTRNGKENLKNAVICGGWWVIAAGNVTGKPF